MKRTFFILGVSLVLASSCSKKESDDLLMDRPTQQNPLEITENSANRILDFYEEHISVGNLEGLQEKVDQNSLNLHMDLLLNIFNAKHEQGRYSNTYQLERSYKISTPLETGLDIYKFASELSFQLDDEISSLPNGVSLRFIQTSIKENPVNLKLTVGNRVEGYKNDVPERLVDLRCNNYQSNGSNLQAEPVEPNTNDGCWRSENYT